MEELKSRVKDLGVIVIRFVSVPVVSWSLLVFAYAGWSLSDAGDVIVAFSSSAFQMGATWAEWKAMPWWPPLLGTLGLTIGIARTYTFGHVIKPRQLLCGGLFVAGTVCARLLALTDVVGYLFPWAGLLWSPLASWAMALFVIVWSNRSAEEVPIRDGSDVRPAAIVFALFAIIYIAYGMFFVKTTSLHGDEAQYLLITQSLLEDGDIDLSNAEAEQKLAFHEFNFTTHRAPASPPGRLHSTHPVGLPVLLTLPYALGDWLWSHPRLGAVLFQTVLTAVACGLLLVFLLRQGFSRTTAMATTLIMGLSAPLLTQSTQLYPEIQAVLITLFVLSLYPKWLFGEVGSDADGTRRCFVASLAIVVLPFFHQRHLILAAVLAAPILLAIYRSGPRSTFSQRVGGVFAGGLLLHLLYNWHFSGDLWGAYLPGNADSIGPDWTQSLLGQWLDLREGLFRHTPVYVLVILGGLKFASVRDRRLMLALALLVATAGVNTLSTDWTFGYCFPVRFMVTAIPVLGLLMAMGLDVVVWRWKPIAIWTTSFGFLIGFETLLQNLVSPELGFEGMNLASRETEAFYPFFAHFVNFISGHTISTGGVTFWSLIVLAMGLSLKAIRYRRVALLIAALAPFLVSHTISYKDLLGRSFAYQLPRFDTSPEDWHYSNVELSIPSRLHGKGVFVSSMPSLMRGRLDVEPLIAHTPRYSGVRAFHTLLLSGGTTRSGARYTVPLINRHEQVQHHFVGSGSAIAKQFFYSLGKPVNPQSTQWTIGAVRKSWSSEVFSEKLPDVGDGNPVSMTLDGFKAGHYKLRLERDGASWGEWVTIGQPANTVAVFTGFDRVRTDAEGLAKMADRWLEAGWRNLNDPLPKTYFPPQVEARIPYFWSLLPDEWDQSEISFTLGVDGPIHIVVLPNSEVQVKGLVIDRVAF